MGLYDREYYRDDDADSWGDWLSGRTVVGLIVVTGVLYFLQLLTKAGQGDELLRYGGFELDPVLGGQVWRVLTAGFLHDPANLLLIVLNMLFLYWFGHPVEQARGGKEFLGFYLAVVVVGFLGEFAFQLLRPEMRRPVFGSVGAVNGVMVLYCFLNPRTQLPLVSLPFWPVVAVIVGMNALGLVVNGPNKTVPLAANPAPTVAAALFALAYYRFDWRVTGWLPAGGRFRRSSRPPLRVVRADEPDEDEDDTPDVPVPAAPAPRRSQAAVDEQLEAKLDFVLEKVARSGKASLTAEENQILLRASEIYKRRRGT